ncbi:MAG: dihydrodipicolinate synthase family protein [Kiritimatiellales bacterium]
MKLPLKGVVPPLITPLKDRDQLDVEGLEKLVEYVLAGGVHGLFLLGSTGEAPGLGYRLRRELIKRVCRQVNGRVPVLVGITDSAIVEALNMSKCAADHGASAVVASTPFYFPAGQPELIKYFKHLTMELPLPMMIYNIPAFTKTMITVETLHTLAEDPKIIGIKDSSDDMIHFHRLLADQPVRNDWSMLMGSEELFAEAVLMGADGGVCGGANVAPRFFVELYNAAVAEDLKKIRELQKKVMFLGASLYHVGVHSSSMIKGIKSTLSLLGICSDFMADPATRFLTAGRKILSERMATPELKELLN